MGGRQRGMGVRRPGLVGALPGQCRRGKRRRADVGGVAAAGRAGVAIGYGAQAVDEEEHHVAAGIGGAVVQLHRRCRRQRGVLPHPPLVPRSQLRHRRDLRQQPPQHLRVDAFHGGTDRARLRPDPAVGLPYPGAGHPLPRHGESRGTAQLDFYRSILGEGVQLERARLRGAKTMKRNHLVLIKRLLAYGLAAKLAAQPAFAQVTISQLPLASAGGNNIVPNLLFTLDNSGSMAWQFVPDYVDPGTVFAVTGNNSSPNNPCMTPSTGNNANTGNSICVEGDPPYSAGGEFAMNGVGYDPNFTYLAGIDSNGQPHVNPPSGTLTPATTPKDAYTASKGTIDVTTAIQDRKYCNTNGVCMRNGQTDATPPATLTANALVSGTDDVNHTMFAGEFPYRTNASNASFKVVSGAQTNVFGLPEMMPIGTFVRNTPLVFVGSPTATVRVTTVEAHGGGKADRIFTTTTTASLNAICTAVTVVNPNTFTYVPGSTTTAANTPGSYRKCDSGNFA